MGLRRLLNRDTAAESLWESLTRLAELAEEPDTPTRRFPRTDRNDEAAPTSPTPIEKTAEQISAQTKEKSPRRQPSYTWLSQKSRNARNEAVMFARTRF